MRAGDAWRQTRKERSGVAGRRTSERGEDARRVARRAATTGRVDGEIQEELKRPSDCWYVPVCRVWGDSEKDTQKDAASPEGSDCAAEEGYEEDGHGPEGSDFAAEEGGPDAEEGYEDVWDEVQETLSRWSMKSLTRLPRPSKVSSVETLFGIIPSVSAVLGCV